MRYDMAQQGCDTRNTVQNTTRDIIDAMNCGFRSIDQRLTAQEMRRRIKKLPTRISSCSSQICGILRLTRI